MKVQARASSRQLLLLDLTKFLSTQLPGTNDCYSQSGPLRGEQEGKGL